MSPLKSLPPPPLVEPPDALRPGVVATARPALVAPCIAPVGKRNGWAMRLVYFGSDLAAFGLSLVMAKAAVALCINASAPAAAALDSRLYLLWLVGLITVAASQQTYAAIPPRPVRKFRGWVLGAATVCVAVVGGAWLVGVGSYYACVSLLVASGLAVLGASFLRAVCRILFGNKSWWGTRLVVLGSGDLAERTYADLVREPQWGLRPVGFIDDALEVGENPRGFACLGSIEELDLVAAKYNIEWALLAVHSLHADELAEQLSRASGQIKHWIILPPLDHFPSLWLEACEAARRPALTVTNRLRHRWSQPIKRTLDLVVAVLAGLVTLPLVALIALLIRIGSPGPIFYGQERVGRYGRRFKAWKFRTMLPSADRVLEQHLIEHPELAEEWHAKHKLRCDPRVTWIGQWLRSTSLDELPQMWNVLVGDMSLVGPRPIVEAEIEKYAGHYEQYVQVMPGITGLWQVSGRNNTTYEERVALDVYYVQNWSVWLDVYILACTAKVVLLCEGAY